MASSRSFRNVVVGIIVLCCAAAGAWFFLHEKGKPLQESAISILESAESGAAALFDTKKTDANREKENSGSIVSGKVNADNAPEQESAASDSKTGFLSADPQEKLLSSIEKAMEKQEAAMPGGDSVSGPVAETGAGFARDHGDSVVTPDFVRSMAEFLVARYVPSRHGMGGRTSCTLMQVNARYSNSSTLRSVERDPLKGRASILNYVFTPGMLEALYRMYADALMEEMERVSRENEKHALTDTQRSDMFSVYAEKLRELACSLHAAARSDVSALAANIHKEAEREAKANEDFARAYMILSEARESGNSQEAAIQSGRMAESSRKAAMHAEKQEKARNDMAYALRSKAEGRTLSSQELVFLGEWLNRRQGHPESMDAAGNICLRLADDMHERAERILKIRFSDSENTPAAEPEVQGFQAGERAVSESVSSAPSSMALPAKEMENKGDTAEQKTVHSLDGSFPEISGTLQRSAKDVASRESEHQEGRTEENLSSPMQKAEKMPPAEENRSESDALPTEEIGKEYSVTQTPAAN